MNRALRLLVAAVSVALVGIPPSTAAAISPRLHPFGDPQTVQISAEGSVVTVTWRVGAADDLTALGVHIGALDQSRVMLDGAIQMDPGDGETVARAEELGEYLLERITVTAGEKECRGELGTVRDLIKEGADVAFECDRPVVSAMVSVRTLTDIHPAYRTLARGPDNQRAAYGETAPEHEWTFAGQPAAAESARASAFLPVVLLGALLISILGVVALTRRRGAAQTSTSQRTE